eukprot:366275-Chlamydomonas_euryale.AAC.11
MQLRVGRAAYPCREGSVGQPTHAGKGRQGSLPMQGMFGRAASPCREGSAGQASMQSRVGRAACRERSSGQLPRTGCHAHAHARVCTFQLRNMCVRCSCAHTPHPHKLRRPCSSVQGLLRNACCA